MDSQERLCCAGGRRSTSRSQDELIGNTRSVLRTIQRSPERVRAYFKPDPVRYAA